MNKKRKMIDYSSFRLNKLNTEEFGHLKLLLFWPLYGIMFGFVERFSPIETYYPMHCAVDDLIPFNEYFVIPYLFWFVFLVGMILDLLLYNVDGFRKMMKFIIITYSVSIAIYLIFPTCQELRPAAFERDNIFTRFMFYFYQFDTNTNVCPSIHVIGSMATVFAVWNDDYWGTKCGKTAAAVICFFICASTVFLKQHSILDVFAALPLCAVAYVICYKPHKKRRENAERCAVNN